MTYVQARKDHEYLWSTYAPADDMTGGYVESDDLERLLVNPTKATARQCYEDQIAYWFQAGPDKLTPCDGWQDDPEVRAIAERHFAMDRLERLLEYRRER